MKKLILFLSLAVLVVANGFSQAVSVEIEEYIVHPNTPYSDDVNLDGYTTYRLYANFQNNDDFLSAVYGVQCEITQIWSEGDMWQSAIGGSAVGNEINPSLYAFAESLMFDSWLTIGMEDSDAEGSLFIASDSPPNDWTENFETDGVLNMSGLVGGALVATNGSPNGMPDANNKVLIGQFTSDACVNGVVWIQSFINGDGENSNFSSFTFSTCGNTFGCTDADADNYDAGADVDDFSCVYPCAIQADEVTAVQPTCAGDANGSIAISVSGFQCAASYQLDDGDVLAIGNWNDLENGEYTITVTDNAGCEYVEVVTLNTEEISVSIESTNVTCFGDGDGTVTGMGSGGTGDLMFDLSDDFSNPMMDINYMGLGQGNYTVYAMDDNGCVVSSNEVFVDEPTEIQTVIQNQSPATCWYTDDAIVVMFSSGGVGPYTYSLDDGDFFASPFNAAGGDYTLTAMDANGCTTTIDATIEAPEEIMIMFDVTNPTCFGDTNGVVVVSATGGNGGNTYSLDGGDIQFTGTFSDLGSGEYMIVVQDNDGCMSEASVAVDDPDEVMVNPMGTDISCFGEIDGSIEVEVTGGTPDYEYSIDCVDYQPVEDFTNLEAGDYTICVLDANGCEGTGDVSITEPAELTASIDDFENEFEGDGSGSISISIDGGTGAYTIEWTGPGGFSSSDEDIDGLNVGQYDVTITDENGCEVTLSQFIDNEVGIEELGSSIQLTLMPNPTSGLAQMNISGLEGEKVSYNVSDMMGRIVKTADLNTIDGDFTVNLDLSDLANGVYNLSVIVGNNQKTIQIVKQY